MTDYEKIVLRASIAGFLGLKSVQEIKSMSIDELAENWYKPRARSAKNDSKRGSKARLYIRIAMENPEYFKSTLEELVEKRLI